MLLFITELIFNGVFRLTLSSLIFHFWLFDFYYVQEVKKKKKKRLQPAARSN